MKNHIQPESQSVNKSPMLQLVVFRAGNEEFGIPIDAVREIIKILPITPIPNSPHFIAGIINVRGEIVTTIDVKSRFSLPSSSSLPPKHIIVTTQEDNLFGLIVDEVIEILRIQQKEINPPPKLIIQMHEDYVKGVVNHNDNLIIILDLSNVLSQQELIKLSETMRKHDEQKYHKEKPKQHDEKTETRIKPKKQQPLNKG